MLNFPIFNGGYQSSKTNEARLNYQKAQLDYKNSKRLIRKDIIDSANKYNLEKDISSKLYHRLDGDKYGWNTYKLLNDLKLKVCKSKISLRNELNQSSLCISSYNSTAALETLSANYPTILYWPKNLFNMLLFGEV